MLTLSAGNTIAGVAETATSVTYTIFGMELLGTTETYRVLAQGQLPTSTGILYTVGDNTTTLIKTILLSNSTILPVSGITLFINGTEAINRISSSITIPASGAATFNQDGWGVCDSYGATAGNAASALNLVGGNATTLLGSIPYQSNIDTTTLLVPNITTTTKFLSQTGTGVNGAAPAWIQPNLSVFAATTSLQLAGIISDETGSGKLVFGTAPILSSNITLGTTGGTTGAILFKGTASGTLTLTTAAAAGTWTLTLPATSGTNGYFLQTNGSGTTTWASVGAYLPLSGGTMSGDITQGAGTSLYLGLTLSSGQYNGITDTGIAGETLVFGNICYLKASDTRWWKALANSVTTSGIVKVAFCVTAASAGGVIKLLLFGKIRADSLFGTLTIGAPVYISATTSGNITSSAPLGTTNNIVRVVGHANTAYEVAVNLSPNYIGLS